MRVAEYHSNKDIRIKEMPVSEPGDKEVLVKVMASGICGSDVMEWYRIKKAPLVLGHEITGIIEATGSQVKQYKVGMRVFVSHHVPCNTCRYCLSGKHTVCETLQSTNYYPGGFSEYIRVPEINVERGIFILGDEISFDEGTFIEPLGCVLRSQRVAQINKGDTVLILGAGVSGLLHLLCAREKTEVKIILTDINAFRLNLAKELGADAVIRADKDVIQGLRQVNAGRLADIVFICTGASAAFKQALETVERAGTIVCFASTKPGVTLPLPVNDFWRKNIRVIHSYGASPSDLSEAIELIRRKNMPLERLITHRLPLEQAGLGFQLVSQAEECLKVILKPH